MQTIFKIVTALPLLLGGCKGSKPPAPEAAAVCSDLSKSFARYQWLPAEIDTLASVKLADPRLSISLSSLQAFQSGPFMNDERWTRFVTELPELRSRLGAGSLNREEAIWFLAENRTSVWAVSGVCDLDEFDRIAAALGLQKRDSGVREIWAAENLSSETDFVLLQFGGSGPMWLVNAGSDQVLSWLRNLSGSRHTFFIQQLKNDHPNATLRILRILNNRGSDGFSQYSITGTEIFKSGFVSRDMFKNAGDESMTMQLTTINNAAPIRIVGAGVSTCAPFAPM